MSIKSTTRVEITFKIQFCAILRPIDGNLIVALLKGIPFSYLLALLNNHANSYPVSVFSQRHLLVKRIVLPYKTNPIQSENVEV